MTEPIEELRRRVIKHDAEQLENKQADQDDSVTGLNGHRIQPIDRRGSRTSQLFGKIFRNEN